MLLVFLHVGQRGARACTSIARSKELHTRDMIVWQMPGSQEVGIERRSKRLTAGHTRKDDSITTHIYPPRSI